MQELLEKLSPKFQAISRQLTHDPEGQDVLIQEMRLHLWEKWQENPNQTPAWYTQSCRYHALDSLKAG